MVNSGDDRPIHAEPADPHAQWRFVTAQCLVARLARQSDPDYAAQCESAALRCAEWCISGRAGSGPIGLGAAMQACAELDRNMPGARWREFVGEYGRRLLSLQVTEPIDNHVGVRGFFQAAEDDARPFRNIVWNGLMLVGLTEALERFGSHKDADRWRAAMEMYARDYLLAMSERTAFGIVPFGLYAEADPGGGRRIGDYWYRWFMKPGKEHGEKSWWWVGVNANVTGHGVGLIKAARLLAEPGLAALAQRQLDWALGANPFDASTMEDVGRNQPGRFMSPNDPPTPRIPGAVMCGIGGTVDDMPQLEPGSWQMCEYWTPMVCGTMWLMAELAREL
jgi:hypothetical protein